MKSTVTEVLPLSLFSHLCFKVCFLKKILIKINSFKVYSCICLHIFYISHASLRGPSIATHLLPLPHSSSDTVTGLISQGNFWYETSTIIFYLNLNKLNLSALSKELPPSCCCACGCGDLPHLSSLWLIQLARSPWGSHLLHGCAMCVRTLAIPLTWPWHIS